MHEVTYRLGNADIESLYLTANTYTVTYGLYYVCGWKKNSNNFSLYYNSEKLVQILLKFSQQIVSEVHVLAKFRWKKRPWLSVNQNLRFKGEVQ